MIKSFADNVRFMANFSGVVTTYAPYSDNVFGYAGGVATIINYQPYWSTTPIGVTITNSRQHRCDGTGLATGINACFSSTERTGATNNAWAHMDCNTVNDGCSLMAGTAFDTKWSRCRAGAWCPGTGQDIYTESGFLCAGTGCSVLSTSLVGVYDGSDRAFATVSCTGATCTKSGKNLDIVVAGVTSITGTANQITASASTGAVTLSTPNPFEANQAAPKINSYGTAIGTAGSLGTIIGSNNAFWVTVTTGSTPSAGGLIARLDWATAWTSGTTANGPACRVSITNPEGVADPAGFMSTYGPKLYAIPVSGSANDSLDLKLAAGASGVALPAVTSFQVLVTCNLVR